MKYSEHKLKGYTGFVPRVVREEIKVQQDAKPMSRPDVATHERQMPGYTGYIKNVKAEGMYGQTYGHTTKMESRG